MRGLLERRFRVLPRSAVPNSCSRGPAIARTRALDDGTLWRLPSGHDVDSSVDEDGDPERRDFVWDISQHVMPRILPPFGFSSVRLRRFVAHPRILRANGSALSSCEGHAGEEAVLGAGQRAEVPHRLATNESVRRKVAEPWLFDIFRVAVLFASGGLQLDFGKAGGAKLVVQRGQIPGFEFRPLGQGRRGGFFERGQIAGLRWRGSGVGAIDFAIESADLRRGAEERGDILLGSRNGFGGRSGNARRERLELLACGMSFGKRSD